MSHMHPPADTHRHPVVESAGRHPILTALIVIGVAIVVVFVIWLAMRDNDGDNSAFAVDCPDDVQEQCDQVVDDVKDGDKTLEEGYAEITALKAKSSGGSNSSGKSGSSGSPSTGSSGGSGSSSAIKKTNLLDGRSMEARNTAPNTSLINCTQPQGAGPYADTGVGKSKRFTCHVNEGFTALVFGVGVEDHNDDNMSWDGGGFRAFVGPADFDVTITDGAYIVKPSGDAAYQEYCVRLDQHRDPNNNWLASNAFLPSDWDPNCGG